ncbi:MAG: hypothetical protein EXS36_15595 [Pedosphaera sp.]|nr:hypothetical protein [Pedosphaera sp.]
MRKFVRRNQAAVAVAASILFALVSVIVFGSVSYQRERAARIEAVRSKAAEVLQRELAEKQSARALAETDRATAKEHEARESALAARRSNYAADMLLAQKFFAEKNRGKAMKLLNKYRLDPTNAALSSTTSSSVDSSGGAFDLRGWEWHHLATATRGDELAVLRGQDTEFNGVCFSPDGRWLASGGLDASVLVWDVKTRSLARRLSVGIGLEVYALAFSPDGKLIDHPPGMRAVPRQTQAALRELLPVRQVEEGRKQRLFLDGSHGCDLRDPEHRLLNAAAGMGLKVEVRNRAMRGA